MRIDLPWPVRDTLLITAESRLVCEELDFSNRLISMSPIAACVIASLA